MSGDFQVVRSTVGGSAAPTWLIADRTTVAVAIRTKTILAPAMRDALTACDRRCSTRAPEGADTAERAGAFLGFRIPKMRVMAAWQCVEVRKPTPPAVLCGR